jgi:hypothetical protein
MVWTSSAGGIHPSKSQVAVAVLVVTGARKRRVATSCFSSSPVKRAHSEPGSLDAAGAGGASSPRAAFQNRLPRKACCHHAAHRFSVRTLTPTCSRSRFHCNTEITPRSPLVTTNTGAKKTLRPKNRTEGGVTLRRQPSRAQQKLCRDLNAAPISPGPPRGLRG